MLKHEDWPMLFVLEDDRELLSDIQATAEEQRWNLESARCVEDAKQRARENAAHIRLVLVDFMVPRIAADLQRVDQLLDERESLVMEWTNHGQRTDFSLDELKRYRQELMAKDEAIAGLIDLNGGLRFLEYAQVQGIASGWVVIVFSARDREKDDLEKRVRSSIPDATEFRWLQKPMSPYDLVNLLRQHRGNADE